MKPQKRDKIWNIKYISGDKEKDGEVDALKNRLGVSDKLAILLHNRGYSTAESAERFLRSDRYRPAPQDVHCPFLL